MTVIAYCILAHKNPRQVLRLLESVYSQTDFFYINVFEVYSRHQRMRWMSVLNNYQRENVVINIRYKNAYATFKVAEALLDSMRRFSRKDYDYFIDLSGQCYPLRPAEYVRHFLSKSNFGYMNATDISTEWPEAAFRFRYSFYAVPCFWLINLALRRLSLARTFGGKMILGRNLRVRIERIKNLWVRIPRISKQLPYGLRPYVGSVWFCLRKRHVDYILKFMEDKPDLIRFFRRVWAPEESFFHSILMNSPLRCDVVNDDLRYVDWNGRRGYPAILNMRDADKLMKSSKLFARKFDVDIDEEILDLIDDQRKRIHAS